MNVRLLSACAAAIALAACAPPPPPTPVPEPEPVVGNDMCYLVQAEAAQHPDLNVDRAPDVVKYDPRPLQPPKGGYPRGVIRRDGTTKVKISVVVDTTGTPDMTTFQVVETTHPWLADNIKALLPKWSFTPAVKTGCHVAGLWVFTAAPGAKPVVQPATKPATRPATKPAIKPAVKPVAKPST